MALIKQLEVHPDTGITGEYWRNAQVYPYPDGDMMLNVLSVYKNKAARSAGKKPIDNRVFGMPKAAMNNELGISNPLIGIEHPTGKQIYDLLWAWTYENLKKSRIVDNNETSFFVDAVDD